MNSNLPKRLLTEAQFKKFRKGKYGYTICLSSVAPLRGKIMGSAFFTTVPLVSGSGIKNAWDKDSSAAGRGYWELRRWVVSYNPANKRYMVRLIPGKGQRRGS